ncbi:MAG: hypothetical protein GEU98_23060 [Pseudonocardiaceae bacterium]|nr:hypothetical protein [Pseudonocardiaceae bacterium]
MSYQRGGSQPDASGKTKALVAVFAVLVLGGYFVSQIIGSFGADESTAVENFERQDSADLANRLATAERAHGICYGWQLIDGGLNQVLSEGSSRGVGTDAEQCARWVEVSADVLYTSENSEQEDSAQLTVRSSPDLLGSTPSPQDFERVGVTSRELIDEPVSSVGYAALSLPLLLAERGVVQPVELDQGAASERVQPLDEAGSDFFGQYTGTIIFLGILAAAVLACLVLGIVASRRRKRRLAAVPPGREGPPPPGQSAYWQGTPGHGPPPPGRGPST